MDEITGYTEGPWIAGHHWVYVDARNQTPIAFVSSDENRKPPRDDQETQANASLIALAPSLYEENQRLVAQLASLTPRVIELEEIERIIDALISLDLDAAKILAAIKSDLDRGLDGSGHLGFVDLLIQARNGGQPNGSE